MRITEQFHIAAAPASVAEMLSDVVEVAGCVPGVEAVRPAEGGEPGAYDADLAVKVGPIKAKFSGSLTLDTSGSPDVIKAAGKGKDRATNSQVSVQMVANLLPSGEGTDVTVEADVAIRGRLGQFGLGIIQGTASELTKSFAACLQSRLAGGEDAAPQSSPAGPSMGRMVAQGVMKSIRGGLRRQ